jgi:hypothetical protein
MRLVGYCNEIYYDARSHECKGVMALVWGKKSMFVMITCPWFDTFYKQLLRYLISDTPISVW